MTLPRFQEALELAKKANAAEYEASAFELYKRVLTLEPETAQNIMSS
jgi:hypothetical protein